MFKKALSVFIITSSMAFASGPYTYITIGSDAASVAVNSIMSLKTTGLKASDNKVEVVKIHKSMIPYLSSMMHAEFKRCGGFMLHDSLEEAKEELINATNQAFNIAAIEYTITEEHQTEKMVSEVEEMNIRTMIAKLSSYHNRFYKSQTGVDSQLWVKSEWERLSQNRTDVTVEEFKHSKWPQPSIIMTIEGTTKADEIVVIGGHGDSISGFIFQSKNKAPGADDNASGIATITEVIRIAMANGYRPERTIKFMSYAAEEVGLLGSKEISQAFKKEGKNVVGVMQLDMTNYKGSSNYDIVFMRDYTNAAQNEFMGKLIDRYVKVPWGYSQCGYGCSDHASWHSQGYPASMPFESTMQDINRKIHTADDTLENSNGNAFHALNFAKLAMAFLVEMGK